MSHDDREFERKRLIAEYFSVQAQDSFGKPWEWLRAQRYRLDSLRRRIEALDTDDRSLN